MEWKGATIWLRKTIESDIFYWKPDKWFKIWFFIINKVNHTDNHLFKRGSNFTTYNEIALYTKATKNQIDKFLRWAKQEKMLTTQKTTRGLIVFVLSYVKYQDYIKTKRDKVVETEEKRKRNKDDTINNNDKNDKNDKEYNSMSPIKISDQSNIELSKLLFKKILKNNPNFKEPNINKWSDDFRKMKEIDRRTDEQIKYLILWSQSNDFWHKNILSPIKLRKHFDRLIVEVRSNKSNNKISKGVRIC